VRAAKASYVALAAFEVTRDALNGRRENMRPVYRTVVDASIWLLFIKGLLIASVTVYTFANAYLAGETTPAVGVAACAAGTFALGMACLAVWIRKTVD
jgi:hypothetical protein